MHMQIMSMSSLINVVIVRTSLLREDGVIDVGKDITFRCLEQES